MCCVLPSDREEVVCGMGMSDVDSVDRADFGRNKPRLSCGTRICLMYAPLLLR